MKATLTKSEKRITVKERRTENILSFDVDNNYPERVRDIVSNSSIGRSCLVQYKKFIYGNGFADETFASTKLNRWGDTSDKILVGVADNLAYFGGFCLHVNYNAKFEITDISFQPLSHVRICLPDSEFAGMYAICKDWGARHVRKSSIDYIDKFNVNPNVIHSQVIKAGGWNSYKGQILYISNEGDEYPLAIYDASLEDMMTDSDAKTYKNRNIRTSFMASHLLFVDKMETPDSENDGNEKNQFIQSIQDFQGADNAGKIAVIEKDSVDQTFELKKVEQQTGDKLFEWTENSVRENIRQAFGIPPALMLSTTNKIGDSNEQIDAQKVYNANTNDERILIESVFSALSKYYFQPLGENFMVAPRETVRREDVPIEIYPDLTKNERRTMFGFPEITEGDTKTMAEKLQVGGTQAFISVLTDTTMSLEQKQGSLKVLFNLSDEQIKTVLPNVVNA